MRHFLILLAVLTVTACSTTDSLKTLRTIQPVGTPYNRALSGEYLKLSEYLEEQADWTTSQYYAEKGLRTAYGERVNFDAIPSERVIGSETYNELSQGVKLFTTYGVPQANSAQPELAARAQVLLDCWIGEIAKQEGSDALDYCQQQFYNAIGALKNLTEKPEGKAPVVSTSYLLFFDWDSTRLTTDALKKITQIMKDIHDMGKVSVTINGHTDRSGEESYNMELSQQRAEVVRDMLVKGGIAETLISLFAFGESDPAVPTADGVKEPENRRVEVFVE
ncbi:MAG: OmpA family protein [Rickettsiales bacterium]